MMAVLTQEAASLGRTSAYPLERDLDQHLDIRGRFGRVFPGWMQPDEAQIGVAGPPRAKACRGWQPAALLLVAPSLAWCGPQLAEDLAPTHREVEQVTTLNHAPVTTIALLVGRAETSINTSPRPGKRVVVLTKPITTIAIWGRATKRIAS